MGRRFADGAIGIVSPMTLVTFLGTGTMGLPMARNLLRAGFDVRAWNRSAERAQPLAGDGAELFDDPRAAAADADVLVTMLSDAGAVLDVAPRALDALPATAIWVQMSTIGIDGTDRCRELAERAGVTLVDAPVLGTRKPAEDAKLVIVASGPDEARDRCRPLFDAVGSRTMWVGEAGAGNRCKVVVNSWVIGVVGVLAETISVAQALGVDPQRFFEAVDGGGLDLPYARMKGKAMIERTFDDASFRLALARKDGDLVLAAAAEAGIELPIMQAITDRMRRAEQDGHGDEDMAATYWVSAGPGAPAAGRRGRV
jgi:3-hydroxyisobutyrate dehydrogenase